MPFTLFTAALRESFTRLNISAPSSPHPIGPEVALTSSLRLVLEMLRSTAAGVMNATVDVLAPHRRTVDEIGQESEQGRQA